jgi:hypothetical protein
VKIQRIYVAGCKRDFEFTRCCVASIRRWYPTIPISLIKDESQGSYDTAELEAVWNVGLFQTDRKLLGFGMGKLEPMFLRSLERSLIIDSDIVFIGRVLEVLEKYDEDFIVADTPNPPNEIPLHYFELDKLAVFDPDFVFPGYTFNSGQLVATAGVLAREDFEHLIRFDEPPVTLHPDIFAEGEQGMLNYVLMKKAQEGKALLRRECFMWWAGWLDEKRVKTRELKQNSPYPFLVHWAGPKRNVSFDTIRNGHLLRHFKREYDRKNKPIRLFVNRLRRLRSLWRCGEMSKC